MGKRSKFKRIEKDAYRTIDPRAVSPLVDFLYGRVRYYEPCVGDGDLVKLLPSFKCVGKSDIERDARTYRYKAKAEYFITNPPWSRNLLHPIIDNLRNQLPTWLLFDADWMHTIQAAPYLKFCKVIISVGRLLWIPETTMTGKDNCAWYLFDKDPSEILFISRKEKK